MGEIVWQENNLFWSITFLSVFLKLYLLVSFVIDCNKTKGLSLCFFLAGAASVFGSLGLFEVLS